MEQVKLLMTELSPELTRLCAETLAAQDIAVTVCEKDGAKALAALSAEKPDAVLLAYPVITAGEYAHRGSFVQLSGSEDRAEHQRFGLEGKITPDTPPVFVWHTMEDATVPVENTLLLLAALRKNHVPCEAHLFEKGVHGTSISTAEVDAASAHRAHWVQLAVEWLNDTFDFHLE